MLVYHQRMIFHWPGNLRKVFPEGKVAVDGMDLDIKEGEIFALLGHNGAGKTTCINCAWLKSFNWNFTWSLNSNGNSLNFTIDRLVLAIFNGAQRLKIVPFIVFFFKPYNIDVFRDRMAIGHRVWQDDADDLAFWHLPLLIFTHSKY